MYVHSIFLVGYANPLFRYPAKQGLSRMNRQHIHLAQGLGQDGVISGMRASSRILIYINLAAAMRKDIKFYLSRNGVILTPGNEYGYLEPGFFQSVERVKRTVRTRRFGDKEVVWENGRWREWDGEEKEDRGIEQKAMDEGNAKEDSEPKSKPKWTKEELVML
jgi:hypothetical protein